ncbi:MAG: ribonuclease P protein component [Caldisericia bacterium]|nr:ribonuclease P protein component [Caldisericia bacterium]MDD4614101.1 ribonuclease P protein component [Caldisericia bacterium]
MASLRKRLKTKAFQTLFSSGFFVPGRHLSIIVKPKPTIDGGFGVTLKKQKRNAVDRNFIRRRLKEAFFLIQNQVSSNIDIVVIGTESSRTGSLSQIGNEILYLLQLAHKKGYI